MIHQEVPQFYLICADIPQGDWTLRLGPFKMRRENRKVGRVILEQPLRVVMCSIGAQVKYELTTRNISYSGFFLEFDSPGRFPFTPASIMEVWLEIEPDQTVFFNGKMARVVHRGDPRFEETGTGIAISIVQIDRHSESMLRSYINKMIDIIPGSQGSVA